MNDVEVIAGFPGDNFVKTTEAGFPAVVRVTVEDTSPALYAPSAVESTQTITLYEPATSGVNVTAPSIFTVEQRTVVEQPLKRTS